MRGHEARGRAAAALARALLAALVLAGLPGCFDPIVGADCAPGYSRCGDRCVDLSSSTDSCGACGVTCGAGVCRAGRCASGPQGLPPDGGADGGDLVVLDADPGGSSSAADAGAGVQDPGGPAPGGDGGAPAREADGGAPGGGADGGPADAPAVFGPGADAAPPVADGSGGAVAGDAPVEADASAPAEDAAGAGDGGPFDAGGGSDPADGGEALDAPPPVALDAGPPLVCPAPTVVCGAACVDVETDPDNCGACGSLCISGLCEGGACRARRAGHLVVIGHDYEVGRPAMNRLVGNAVFLNSLSPLVVTYEGAATPASVAGTRAAIDQIAAETQRSWTRQSADVDPARFVQQLAAADVLLVHAQRGAEDDALLALGDDWAPLLRALLDAGKTLIVLDGASPLNGGTVRLLEPAGLFSFAARTEVTGSTLTLIAPGDAVAARVPLAYRGESSSVSYVTGVLNPVVRAAVGTAVVVHAVY